jgi:predicted HAD superfamily Cof-like phosphohydrolase
MKEELDEYKDAALKGDIIEVADALGDKLYILLGTILAHGMQDVIIDVFNEIHRSNMTKLTKDGKVLRREDGKIIKSDRYEPPNLKSII